MTDVADIDYATWLTKAQAAEALNVNTKTVERLVDEGKIQKSYWQPRGRGPTRVVYAPEDVAREAAKRQRGPLPPFLVPSGAPAPTNGNGATGLSPITALATTSELPSSGEELLRVLVTAAVRVMSETSQTSAAFLTIPEASLASGLSQAYLRRQCQSGWAGGIKDGAWKIRRKDLEQL